MKVQNEYLVTPPVLTKFYESPQQAIVAAGAITLAHGLGMKPKLIQANLVCVTADQGFVVGDEIIVNPAVNPANANAANCGQSIRVTATEILIRIGSGSSGISYVVNSPTTGSGIGLINTSWRLVMRAWA